MKKMVVVKCGALLALAGLRPPAMAGSRDLTIRYAPYVVSSVSSKSEHAWVSCRYCGKKVGYERTYRWDVYDKVWCETTKEVPDVCRACKSKDKTRERLDREESKLDREIACLETKARVDEKRERLRQLRAQTR